MKPSDLQVAFILGANGIGGTESQSRALIAQLVKRGVRVQVFLLDGSAGVGGLPEEQTEVLSWHRPRGPLALLLYARIVWHLRSVIRRRGFDVVHGALARGYIVAMLACLGQPGPLRIAWRRNVGLHLTARSPLFWWLERRAIASTDLIVSNSDDVRDFWLELSGAAPSKFRVIPNLVEPWRFEPVPPAMVPSTDFRLVCVGGLKAGKGHDVLLQAVSEVPAPCEVVLVGDGARRVELEQLATRLGVTAVWTGTTTDPRPWLCSADAYVHPSLSEGSSNAVLEAMAQGLPVIATRVGGMHELVGETAVLVEPDSASDLADAITWASRHRDAAASLGREGRHRVATRVQVEEIVGSYLDLYRTGLACAG